MFKHDILHMWFTYTLSKHSMWKYCSIDHQGFPGVRGLGAEGGGRIRPGEGTWSQTQSEVGGQSCMVRGRTGVPGLAACMVGQDCILWLDWEGTGSPEGWNEALGCGQGC